MFYIKREIFLVFVILVPLTFLTIVLIVKRSAVAPAPMW